MSTHHRIVGPGTQGLKILSGALWLAASRLHRVWRSRRRPRVPPPLLVVGSTRSGGTCKTDFVAWIAARHPDLAILVHRTGDEDAWLASRFPERVFARRDFLEAWEVARRRGFFAAVCDGGLQDPGLDHCAAFCMDASRPAAGFSDLLPFGPYRELSPTPRERLWRISPERDLKPTISVESLPPPGTGVAAACSVARPEAFFADLERSGLVVAERLAFRDHAPFDPRTVDDAARKHPGKPWVVTEKDKARGEFARLPAGSVAACRILTPSRRVAEIVDAWCAEAIDRTTRTSSGSHKRDAAHSAKSIPVVN